MAGKYIDDPHLQIGMSQYNKDMVKNSAVTP